ncbi:DegT/DnrJ/EryC1/StrS family aminotransferase [Methylobacterium nonmethylotrophicum]|uniref:DegT/DnrJ/EryC1/StrS family aminotransferase n=1 Tax=Methylobacterium nonmethylotrophicum TaxID=1141884 RepID=UPI001436C2D0|nr:DegT/DnrJ/EryC1/StrS aminotransferase family protein [Methylobacterium nonmethylotrophicum]
MPRGDDPDAPLRLIKPNPPRLSDIMEIVREIEASGRFSNYGPVNERLERALVRDLFGDVGACVTVGNATLGLMLAIRQAVGAADPRRRYALMPAFTFAATAQAALWCGLTPLLCDIDPETWLAAPGAEDALAARYGEEIAVVVPCTTFGAPIDAAHYDRLSRTTGAAVVVDAAAAVGSRDEAGLTPGAGQAWPSVYSMHATKPFATLEGGFVYAADPEPIRALRAMANFGFAAGRSASLPGLNAKLNEVTAAMGLVQLDRLAAAVRHREVLAASYRALLPDLAVQRSTAAVQAHVFLPALLPRGGRSERDDVIRRALSAGIEIGTYYDPHLGAQPYFQQTCRAGPLPVAEDVGGRMLSLPLHDTMTMEDVHRVADVLREICR